MLKKIHIILSLLLFAASVSAQDPAMTVAERNAAQGFNDTIDRLAPAFVTVSLVVCDPDEVLYSSYNLSPQQISDTALTYVSDTTVRSASSAAS